MAKKHAPRRGSLQFWPRVRAKRAYARIRSWAKAKETKPLGFAGYKVGMTHVIITDNQPNSMTKGQEISLPVTIIECPPMKIASVRFYKNTVYGIKTLTEVLNKNLNQELKRKITLPKKATKKLEDIKPEDYDDLRIIVYTQPKLTGIGKKKPEIFEIALGGNKEEKLNYVKENLDKEIKVEEVFKEGQSIDLHGITKGKGFQGPVKRFGVSIKSHKSEKKRRSVGNLGAWTPKRTSWRVPQAGKMGFHQRTEYNKWVLKIGNDPKEVNTKGGFIRYGNVKNQYILLKGSVIGAKKRLIRLTDSIRPTNKLKQEAPSIEHISSAL